MKTTRLSMVSVSSLLFGALALGLAGCGAPESASGDESEVATRRGAITLANVNISGTAQTATLGTPPANSDAATVTFFSEAALWGDSLTKQV
ncbi:MAG TPA: hypothetical protein VH934_25050, partial [Xanthobacteraceae bacterium]